MKVEFTELEIMELKKQLIIRKRWYQNRKHLLNPDQINSQLMIKHLLEKLTSI